MSFGFNSDYNSFLFSVHQPDDLTPLEFDDTLEIIEEVNLEVANELYTEEIQILCPQPPILPQPCLDDFFTHSLEDICSTVELEQQEPHPIQTQTLRTKAEEFAITPSEANERTQYFLKLCRAGRFAKAAELLQNSDSSSCSQYYLDVKAYDKWGQTGLHYFAWSDYRTRVKVINRLLDGGCDRDQKNVWGYTATLGNPYDIKVLEGDDYALFLDACRKGSIESVNEGIRKGPLKHYKVPEAFELAILNGHLEILKLVIHYFGFRYFQVARDLFDIALGADLAVTHVILDALLIGDYGDLDIIFPYEKASKKQRLDIIELFLQKEESFFNVYKSLRSRTKKTQKRLQILIGELKLAIRNKNRSLVRVYLVGIVRLLEIGKHIRLGDCLKDLETVLRETRDFELCSLINEIVPDNLRIPVSTPSSAQGAMPVQQELKRSSIGFLDLTTNSENVRSQITVTDDLEGAPQLQPIRSKAEDFAIEPSEMNENTKLFLKLCRVGRFQKAAEMLENVADLDVKAYDQWGRTAFHYFAKRSYDDRWAEAINKLCEKGGDYDRLNVWGYTAYPVGNHLFGDDLMLFLEACRVGAIESVNEGLCKGIIEGHLSNKNVDKAFKYAISNGHLEVLKLLMHYFGLSSELVQRLLRILALDGKLDAANAILDTFLIGDETDLDIKFPYRDAANNGRFDIIDLFLKREENFFKFCRLRNIRAAKLSERLFNLVGELHASIEKNDPTLVKLYLVAIVSLLKLGFLLDENSKNSLLNVLRRAQDKKLRSIIDEIVPDDLRMPVSTPPSNQESVPAQQQPRPPSDPYRTINNEPQSTLGATSSSTTQSTSAAPSPQNMSRRDLLAAELREIELTLETDRGKSFLLTLSKRFEAFLQTSFTSEITKEFCDQIVRCKGGWGIDLAQLSNPKLKKDDFLKPFQLLQNSCKTDFEKKVAAYFIISWFGNFSIYDSSCLSFSSSSIITHPIEFANFNINRHFLHQRSYPKGKLSDFLSEELGSTFLWLKILELKAVLRQKNFLIKTDTPISRPVYILAPDSNEVRVFLTNGRSIRYRNRISYLEGDEDHKAYEYLTTKLIDPEKILKRTEDYVVISYEDSLKLVPSDDILILKQQPLLNYFPGKNERAKRTRTPSENLEGSDSPKRARNPRADRDMDRDSVTLNDLDFTQSRKRGERTSELQQRVSKRGTKSYRELEFSGHWEPSTNEVVFEDHPMARLSRPLKSSSGPLPIIGSLESSASDEISLEGLTGENFYNLISEQSIREVQVEVAKEVAKELAIHKTIQPLKFPLAEKLEALPSAEPLFNWNRKLKAYQKMALEEILRARLGGVSILLSFDMGLGKTITFSEYLIQLISEGGGAKVHVVVAPGSLVPQHHEMLKVHFMEAVIVAWQLTAKTSRTAPLGLLFEEFLKEPESKENLIAFLRIFSSFSNAYARCGEYCQQFMNLPAIEARIVSLLEEHLNEIESYLQDTPDLKNSFEKEKKELFKKFGFREDLTPKQLVEQAKVPFEGAQQMVRFKWIGAILNLHPGRAPLPREIPEISESSYKSIRELGFTQKQLNQSIFTDPRVLQNEFSSTKVFISSFETFFKATDLNENSSEEEVSSGSVGRGCLIGKPIGSVVVDEASCAHNPETKTSKELEKGLRALDVRSGEGGKNNVLLVTGTPFENSLLELFTLLRLGNSPENVPMTTYYSLMKLYQEVIKKIVESKINNSQEHAKKTQELFSRAFTYFSQFGQMIEKLVHSRKKTDLGIIDEWHGRISTATHHFISPKLEEGLLNELNDVSQPQNKDSQGGQGSFIKEFKRKSIKLIHPEITINTKIEDLPRPEEKDRWIERSPQLQAILTNEIFESCLRNRDKIVIVAEYIVQSMIFKDAILHKFGTTYPTLKVFEYNGLQKAEERAVTLKKFQKRSTAKHSVLLLMMKSGGQGLDIPQGDALVLLPKPWNPGVEEQVINRIVRVNQVKNKTILHLKFPDLKISEHPALIQQMKRAWEALLIGGGSTSSKEKLKIWSDLISAEVMLKWFNFEWDGNALQEQRVYLTEKLNSLVASHAEEELDVSQERFRSPRIEQPVGASSSSSVDALQLRGPVGIENEGRNNCWLNAFVQLMTASPALEEAYKNFAEHFTKQKTPAGLEGEISHRKDLLEMIHAYRSSNEFVADVVSQNCRNALHHFFPDNISSYGRQEDVNELFSLVTTANKNMELNPFGLFFPVRTIRTYEKIPTIGAAAQSQMTADPLPPNGVSVVESSDSTLDIFLEGRDDWSFERLLNNAFVDSTGKHEPVHYSVDGIVERYNVKEIRKQFVEVPDELFVSFKNYTKKHQKIFRQVDVPLRFELPSTATMEGTVGIAYELNAFVIHDGFSTNFGHYFTCKKVNGEWWNCNDKSVTKMSEGEVESILRANSYTRMTSCLHHYRRV